MATLRDFMKVTDYRITEGSDYEWSCYGPYAYSLDCWNGVHNAGGYSMSVVFDTKTQEVYQIEACDYTNQRAYQYVIPEFRKAYDEEASTRSYDDQAWDDVNWTRLETEEDFWEKATSIVNGEVDYDTRIQVPLDIEKDDMFKLMQLAHERDITFNELVERVLVDAIAATDELSEWR